MARLKRMLTPRKVSELALLIGNIVEEGGGIFETREASEFSKINFDVGRRAAVVFNREVG